MSNPNQIPAHALWVELTTRITSQTLHYRSGDEETAAESVYKLFPKTRELMEKHPEATAFHRLALWLLNDTLRPYTARWHRWMTANKPVPGEPGKTMPAFKDEQTRRLFRSELIELQGQLRAYAEEFKLLAEAQEEPPAAKPYSPAGLSPRSNAATLGQNVLRAVLPDPLAEAEFDEVLARRVHCNRPLAEQPLRNASGLALSGGGIRSATFCLGIVQTLADKRLFHHFDYLSTVSGGGYLGAFLSSTLSDDATNLNAPPTQIIDEVLIQEDKGKDSQAVRHLRNNSKYLGAGGLPRMAGLMFYGIFTNVLLLLPAPFFLALFVYALDRYVAYWDFAHGSLTLSAYCSAISGALLLISIVVLPFLQSIAHSNPASWWAFLGKAFENVTLSLAITTLFFLGLHVLPALFEFRQAKLPNLLINARIMLFAGAVPMLSAYGTQFLNAWKRMQNFVLVLFILCGPLFFLAVFIEAGHALGFRKLAYPVWNPGWFLIATFALWVWGWLLVNINTLSPHRYYRNRLCDCYLLKRAQRKIKSRTDLPLTELGHGRAAPYHLLNATVNLTTSHNRELRGRNGDFFLFSKHYCGSKVTKYHATQTVVAKNPSVDLGTAMAISGAAASVNMGWQTMAAFRFLMGLMNVRLGFWLLNPDPAHKVRCKTLEGPGPLYLYKELFSKMKEENRYLNLSDGGHIENLAAYELLKRKCKFIVCVDGGHEPGMECADLIRLQRYAEIDLGIRMEYDIADLQMDENRFSRACGILVKIIYAEPKENEDWSKAEVGWMLYLKLAMTGAEPAYVTDYRRMNPTFPHQTTANQFFDEAQFEAYRMLGECAAESFFRRELVGPAAPETLDVWFQALADHLLPDNDAVFSRKSAS